MNNQQKYSIELALDISNPDIYKRGREYFNQGRVVKTWKEGDKDLAFVQGTDIYKVTLYFDNDELISNCSCPYEDGNICKHIIAAILSLSNINKIIPVNVGSKKDVSGLISKLTLKDAQEFIGRITSKDSEIAKSLWVFAQGQNESLIKAKDYYTKFKKELSQISPESLLESFHLSEQQYDYDDYWDNDGGYDDDNDLSEWVDEIIDLVSKYYENNNYKEALKIYFSATQAYFERSSELEEKYSELGDWTEIAGAKLVTGYITFLGNLSKEHFEVAILDLEKLVKVKQLKNHKSELVVLLSSLYSKSQKWSVLENFVDKYLKYYPPVCLDLLLYYKESEKTMKLRKLSEKVLLLIPKNEDIYSLKLESYYDCHDLEIKIRRLLIEVYDSETEYELSVGNIERLFMVSKNVKDFKILKEKYKSVDEKNSFLQKSRE